MKTHISIISLREQILKKISNYRDTITGIGNDDTEWHHKQIKNLQGKISDLEWVLTLIPEPKPFCLTGTIDDGIEEKFLENTGIFQREEKSGLFLYTSDNEMHISNLVALLEDYREHLVALSEKNKVVSEIPANPANPPYSMYEGELNKIGKLPQAQFSTDKQLSVLMDFANKLGLYDAADFIKNR